MNLVQPAVKPFSVDEFIDREAERELFGNLLAFQDEARLLTIRDDTDRGKSHLLKLLRYKCQFASTPPVPVSLVPLDELRQKSAYSFVRSIERPLRQFGLDFKQFRAATDNRIAALMSAPARQVSGEANVAEAQLGNGGRVAGIIVEGDATFTGAADLDPDIEERLQEQAVEAFLADLRQASSNQPLVVLIDTYEECGQELEDWIPGFLRDHVFDDRSRLENLVVVIAGQQVPTGTFKLMLGPRFDQVVKSVESLSLWEPDHVREFLKVTQVTGYGDEDVALICAKLTKGWPIGRAVAAVEQYLREEASS